MYNSSSLRSDHQSEYSDCDEAGSLRTTLVADGVLVNDMLYDKNGAEMEERGHKHDILSMFLCVCGGGQS